MKGKGYEVVDFCCHCLLADWAWAFLRVRKLHSSPRKAAVGKQLTAKRSATFGCSLMLRRCRLHGHALTMSAYGK